MRVPTVPLSRTRRHGRKLMVLLGLVVILITNPTRGDSKSRRTPVVEAVQKVMPSVVSISSEKRAASNSRWPFSTEENQRPRVSGMGTGVIIDDRGYILTNQHVVDRVQNIEVHLSDGSVCRGEVVQQDPVMDIALLKIEAGRPVPAIRIGSSADVMVGEDVITIGNAFGYENTVSVGIISYVGRNVTLSDEQVYRNLIQTDACINPGNSGGPLVNIDGELIGINVAVRAGAQGIGFALPIDDVKKVAAEMLSTRRLASTWHGIVAGEILKDALRSVIVRDIQPGSPAEAAGFQSGDQVVRVGDLEVNNPLDIERGLLDLRPGQKINVVVNRAGQSQTIPLEVQQLPRSAPNAAEHIWRTLGIKIQPVTREYVSAVSPNFRGGLYVSAVSPGSPAAQAMIQRGDILVGMNVGKSRWETIQPENLLYILTLPEVFRLPSVQYYLVRQNQFVEGSVSLANTTRATARR